MRTAVVSSTQSACLRFLESKIFQTTSLCWEWGTRPLGKHSEEIEREGRIVALNCLLFFIVHSTSRPMFTDYPQTNICWLVYEISFAVCYLLCRSPWIRMGKWVYHILINTCPYISAICFILNGPDGELSASPVVKWVIFPIIIASYLFSHLGVMLNFLTHVLCLTLIYQLTALKTRMDLNFGFNIALGVFWITTNLAQRRLADESLRAKQVFTSSVSHELRTPLNAVLASLELVLDDKSLNESSRRLLTLAQESGDLMLHLVSDLLDYSRVSMGHFQMNFEEVYLRTCVAQAAGPYTLSAEHHHVPFSIEIAQDVPEKLWSDPRRIRQNLGNLLSNAFKFTDQGTVQLRVDFVDKRYIKFQVKDTGMGIPFEQQRLLFRPFVRLDYNKPGTGLGLVNCQQIARALGGDCGFSSVAGEGSCFWFTIEYQLPTPARTMRNLQRTSLTPSSSSTSARELQLKTMQLSPVSIEVTTPMAIQRLESCQPNQQSAQLPPIQIQVQQQQPQSEVNSRISSPQQPQPSLQVQPEPHRREECKKKVLLVEDNAFNQQVAAAMLQSLNYQFVLARDGNECLNIYWRNPDAFFVILMDCQMPVMDGYEASTEIRKRERILGISCPIPIIALTADASDGNRNRCLLAGMDLVCTKPIKRFDLEQLLLQMSPPPLPPPPIPLYQEQALISSTSSTSTTSTPSVVIHSLPAPV